MRPLRREERVFLKALAGSFAVLGGIAIVAASCLERDRNALVEPGYVETTAGAAATTPGSTVSDSTGGFPALDEAGTTAITSAPADESVAGTNVDTAADAASPQSSSVRQDVVPSTPAVDTGDAGATTTPPATGEAGSAGGTTIGDGGTSSAPPPASTYNGPSFSAGAGPFLTEPPTYGASSWTPNPEAGAGPFTTDRSSPPDVVYFGVPPNTSR